MLYYHKKGAVKNSPKSRWQNRMIQPSTFLEKKAATY